MNSGPKKDSPEKPVGFFERKIKGWSGSFVVPKKSEEEEFVERKAFKTITENIVCSLEDKWNGPRQRKNGIVDRKSMEIFAKQLFVVEKAYLF
jgi:hypothetical protein